MKVGQADAQSGLLPNTFRVAGEMLQENYPHCSSPERKHRRGLICDRRWFCTHPEKRSTSLFQICFKRRPQVADLQDEMTMERGEFQNHPLKQKRRLQLGSGGIAKKWRKGTGFEPSTRFPVCRVSGALSHSATFPRLQNLEAQPGFEPGCEAFAALPRSLSATGPCTERAARTGCAQSKIESLVNVRAGVAVIWRIELPLDST